MKILLLTFLSIVLRTTANAQSASKDSLFYKFSNKIDSLINKGISGLQPENKKNKLGYITLLRNERDEILISVQSIPLSQSPQFKRLLLNSNRYFRDKEGFSVTILTDWDYIFGGHFLDKERGGGYVIRFKDDEILFSGYSQ